jgi:hypothetical protein
MSLTELTHLLLRHLGSQQYRSKHIKLIPARTISLIANAHLTL